MCAHVFCLRQLDAANQLAAGLASERDDAMAGLRAAAEAEAIARAREEAERASGQRVRAELAAARQTLTEMQAAHRATQVCESHSQTRWQGSPWAKLRCCTVCHR